MEEIDERLINELASVCGIIGEYWDIFGNRHTASMDSKIKVLKAMGIETDKVTSIEKEIERRKWLAWKRFIDPVFVFSLKDNPLKIPIYLQCDVEDERRISIDWSIYPKGKKNSSIKSGSKELKVDAERFIDGKRYVRLYLHSLTDNAGFAIGYYQLSVLANVGSKRLQGKSAVIICPDTCYSPAIWQGTVESNKLWGLSLNLYSLRSGHNWGVGDLSDLRSCIKETAQQGGAFVGINPLHAITNQRPFGISPYSPISRLYRNFIYIDIKGIDGMAGLRLSEDILLEIERLRGSVHIDYEAVAALKLAVLRELFEDFYRLHIRQKTKDAKPFMDYIEREGELLQGFALYCSIAEQAAGRPLYSWRAWDRGFHKPDSEEVYQFKQKHEKTVLFYCFLQWLIDCQLKVATREAEKMSIGIYNDLAVGSIRDGYDEWIYQGIFATSADAGAPPDDFNPKGQNWGFPPMDPFALREAAYEPFIQCLRKNMQYAGALRIDHALGLFRMFWIPFGCKPSEGLYVENPWHDILRIIALESHLNKTVIIAEDLGTITDQAREALRSFNMLSYRLLYFQRNYPDPSFVAPEDYPPVSLCTVTTHDLPTLNGFWIGRDIELRRRLLLFKTQEDYHNAKQARERDKGLLIDALIRCGILPEGFNATKEMTPAILIAVYEFLGRSRSTMLAISLDDLLGTLDQQNMPGTVEEYPCWIQKTPILIEEFLKGQTFLDLARTLNRYRQNH